MRRLVRWLIAVRRFPEIPARVLLTIAGHTLGGQVRFTAGYVEENGQQMFVATGIGTSIFPVRFRVAPTITMLIVGNQ